MSPMPNGISAPPTTTEPPHVSMRRLPTVQQKLPVSRIRTVTAFYFSRTKDFVATNFPASIR
jgi:hypothetical protein